MVLELNNLCKTYDNDVVAVDKINLVAHAGELVVLLGESGCGKTTTLKMINRLIEPSSGTIFVNGRNAQSIDAVSLRRSIGYVFQGIGLFPHLTVEENVGVTPQLLGWDRQRINMQVDRLLKLVHLPPDQFKHRLPEELSGGQQQRVGFARALAAGPSIMLLDEPFGALDPLTRDALQNEFKQIQKDLNLTAVLVTHDMTEALLLADRIVVMRYGRIVQEGSPRDLLTAPKDDYISSLMSTPLRQVEQIEHLLKGPGAGRTPFHVD